MTGERRGMERRPSLHNIISCLPSTSGKSNKKLSLNCPVSVTCVAATRACTPAAHTAHPSLVPTTGVIFLAHVNVGAHSDRFASGPAEPGKPAQPLTIVW